MIKEKNREKKIQRFTRKNRKYLYLKEKTFHINCPPPPQNRKAGNTKTQKIFKKLQESSKIFIKFVQHFFFVFLLEIINNYVKSNNKNCPLILLSVEIKIIVFYFAMVDWESLHIYIVTVDRSQGRKQKTLPC